MVGLSLDEDPVAWEAALKRLDLPWSQGRLPPVRFGESPFILAAESDE